ncbi:sensor histidine kinase [Alicyclobacillus ferrooxydans]|uniref:sensor histidine kinase n=1 Tax=Alicyclobacillus ferrooxydans TaxID=471514 RepID=UPI000B263106|nr:histidine kinase [Alicyclobacillus ferrooxydans]
MDNHIHTMQNTIQHTLAAIADGQANLKQIVECIQNERARVEFEFAEMKMRYDETSSKIQELVFHAQDAREQLTSLGQFPEKQSWTKVQKAIDRALELQTELGQAQERHSQLHERLDDLNRRIRLLGTFTSEVDNTLEELVLAGTKLEGTVGTVSSVLEMRELQDVLAVRTVEMVEDERRRFAEHLHDGPLQHLVSLLMKAESAYRLSSQSMELGVALDLKGRLNDVIGSIRQIVFDLRPPLLDDLGLVPAVRRYAAQWAEETGIETTVSLVGVETLLNHTEKVALFRVTQSVLQQAREQTDTSKVSINITYGAGRVMIQVISNGQEVKHGNWLERIEIGQVGLALCRQRVLALGGQFSISSALPVGTAIQVALPLSHSENILA